MKEAEELLNMLDNYHKDFRPNRLKIVEDFLKSHKVAPEPRKPREWSVHVVTADGTMITSFPFDERSVVKTIRVREVLENE